MVGYRRSRIDARDEMNDDARHRLAELPQVEKLLRHPDAAEPIEAYGRRAFRDTIRRELEAVRRRVAAGRAVDAPERLVANASERLARERGGDLRRVVNATGVVLHTNLGRAPLAEEARRAVADATGYTTLEYDPATGGRGSRTAHLGSLAATLCGTADATVVNNGAAALALALAALAAGRPVVVSRGELIEIGGAFRLPEMMLAVGCRLIEVGTTNRTRIEDYRTAITDETALLLKVHRSNYEVVGFTEEASASELAALAREVDLPFLHDLGSGLLRAVADGPLAGEPAVETSVRAGADLVVFSGDKLLGGPQAGIVAGREDLVDRCRRHPLARAVRVDKLQRAALEATFAAHLRSDTPTDVPTIAMLTMDAAALRSRAEAIAGDLGEPATAREVEGVVGGGSLPGVSLTSWAVAIEGPEPSGLAARLRGGSTPVIGRIEDDRLLLDLRTVDPSQDRELTDLVRDAWERPRPSAGP